MTTPPRPLIKDEETPPPTSPSSTPKRSTGNFANDPGRAAEAGRKGGQASPTNFKNDPGRAAEAGRKGAVKAPATSSKTPIVLARRAAKVGANAPLMPRNDHPIHSQSLAPPRKLCLRLSLL